MQNCTFKTVKLWIFLPSFNFFYQELLPFQQIPGCCAQDIITNICSLYTKYFQDFQTLFKVLKSVYLLKSKLLIVKKVSKLKFLRKN